MSSTKILLADMSFIYKLSHVVSLEPKLPSLLGTKLPFINILFSSSSFAPKTLIEISRVIILLVLMLKICASNHGLVSSPKL